MAESLLERIIGWIGAADSKIGAVFALDISMLGVLAALLPNPDSWSITAAIFSSLATIGLLSSLVFLSLSSFPRTTGPKSSLLFFGSIAAREVHSYLKEMKELSDVHYLDDLLKQCHRNAEIAQTKYYWIQRSLWAMYLSAAPWLIAIYVLYRKL
jgi:hypothetical protein